jgi:hypothetical protein
MDKPEYNKKFNLRLPQELYDKIVELGNAYERSVNEQMVYMFKTWQEPASFEGRLARIEEQVFGNETKRQ